MIICSKRQLLGLVYFAYWLPCRLSLASFWAPPTFSQFGMRDQQERNPGTCLFVAVIATTVGVATQLHIAASVPIGGQDYSQRVAPLQVLRLWTASHILKSGALQLGSIHENVSVTLSDIINITAVVKVALDVPSKRLKLRGRHSIPRVVPPTNPLYASSSKADSSSRTWSHADVMVTAHVHAAVGSNSSLAVASASIRGEQEGKYSGTAM